MENHVERQKVQRDAIVSGAHIAVVEDDESIQQTFKLLEFERN